MGAGHGLSLNEPAPALPVPMAGTVPMAGSAPTRDRGGQGFLQKHTPEMLAHGVMG